jgi:hypothetical protein
MAAVPLGSLLSQSWSQFRASLTPILIGAVVFGTVMAVMQMYVQQDVQRSAGTLMEGMGIDPVRMEELGRLAEAGDEAALQEMMAGLDTVTQQLEGMTEEEQAAFMGRQLFGAFSDMLPALSVVVLLSMLVGIIAWTYFAVLALKGTLDPMMIARQTPGLIFPMIGLSIWVILRSFIWIPIIGIIPAVILLPRFVAAIVYLVRDGKGVLESARLSYGATAGYWGKIWSDWIVLGILLLVVAMVVNIVIGIVAALSHSLVGIWGTSVVQQLLSAFAILFSVKLALTIMENPRTTAVAQ